MIRILDFDKVPAEEIFDVVVPTVNVSDAVREIIEDVRQNGDAALRKYAEKFDGVKNKDYRLELEEGDLFYGILTEETDDESFREVLRSAAANIARFHKNQLRSSFIINDKPGVVVGQKVMPLKRVGVYVPGGTAAYPSTVLMDTIPALIAGCEEVILVTPPDENGQVNPAIIAAADVAEYTVKDAPGMIRIFATGGAQAIAALAYGTESIPKVDKIVGPGNAYVAEAKRQVFGQVAIDMIAGPSEILVIADGASNPVYVAADMLSQAEHDKLASAVLITDSAELAVAVQAEIEKQLKELEREEIARASIENNGKIIVVDNLAKAIDTANEIAPEHLELCVDQPFDWLDKIKNAGSVFLGRNCPEALGDYFAGPNHTLPTCGTARFSNPLSVDDFVKKMQYTYYSDEALDAVADDIAAFARKEGLTGHARSALIRKESR